jgi:hypothetical protein
MMLETVEKIANAVLYEGYLLYPYRKSAVKNRQRFNFGVLYPPEFCQDSDTSEMRTECLVWGRQSAALDVKVRFLQLIEDQGRECEVNVASAISSLIRAPMRREFQFEPCAEGEVDISASQIGDGFFKISLAIRNRSDFTGDSRDRALAASLISVHSILRVEGAEFISLLDPPEQFRPAAQACQNQGAWPVLAGDPSPRDPRYASMLLASPIILYDFPQVAPESAGDLFDATEIDEILALRILTMTDEEKREIRDGDDRARRILERTESLPPEHFQKLHGALRSLGAAASAVK